jgi:hypothetical protein
VCLVDRDESSGEGAESAETLGEEGLKGVSGFELDFGDFLTGGEESRFDLGCSSAGEGKNQNPSRRWGRDSRRYGYLNLLYLLFHFVNRRF